MLSASEKDHRLHDVHEPCNAQVVALLLEHYHTSHAFVAQRVSSDTVADDLLQRRVQKAYEYPVRALGERCILAWFYRILRRTRVDDYPARAAEKHARARWVDAVIAESRLHMPAVDETPATLCRCVEAIMPTSKPVYAELLQRIDLGEESVAMVARGLEITENNLHVRLHRARQALKRQLERTCGTCTEGGCLHYTCTANDLPVPLEAMGGCAVCGSEPT